MGIFKSLFGHKAEIEPYTVPEDIFFSSGYVYYEDDDVYVKNGTYDVFTLYPSLYDENSDDNFYKLCDDIVKEVLKDSLIILSIKIIDISFKDELLNNILNLKNNSQIFEYEDRFIIVCDINTMLIDFKTFEDNFENKCIYEIYGCKKEFDISNKEKALNIISENKFDLYLYYYKYPDYLEFKIKKGTDINDIINKIGTACKKRNRRFFIQY